LAATLPDRLFFPVKACPEPEIVQAALASGCDLDLCSEGDVDMARAAGCPGSRWKFTSAIASDLLLRRLHQAGALLAADSLDQALRWGACGGKACALRITAPLPRALYGAKFGVPAAQVAAAAAELARAGVQLEGLLVHDQHNNLTPAEFATRLAETFTATGKDVLRGCRYLNIGGSWPMRHGQPARVEDLQEALGNLRRQLAAHGFHGSIHAEPGRWIVEPCGYWAASVAAVKSHPAIEAHRVMVLDTSTPVPCRPCGGPFVLLRDGEALQEAGKLSCDIFGAANTALDWIGRDVRLPAPRPGDLLVILGQGAYTRSLIPPFNERPRPASIMVGVQAGRSG
jgi:diaminopimelate decarboxylase